MWIFHFTLPHSRHRFVVFEIILSLVKLSLIFYQKKYSYPFAYGIVDFIFRELNAMAILLFFQYA